MKSYDPRKRSHRKDRYATSMSRPAPPQQYVGLEPKSERGVELEPGSERGVEFRKLPEAHHDVDRYDLL